MKTEAQPQHTKGEWKLIPEQLKIVSERDDTIASCGYGSPDISLANAQRILKAVNMHDELIEALKKMVDERGFRGEPRNSFVLSFEEKVLELLKQAEEK